MTNIEDMTPAEMLAYSKEGLLSVIELCFDKLGGTHQCDSGCRHNLDRCKHSALSPFKAGVVGGWAKNIADIVAVMTLYSTIPDAKIPTPVVMAALEIARAGMASKQALDQLEIIGSLLGKRLEGEEYDSNDLDRILRRFQRDQKEFRPEED